MSAEIIRLETLTKLDIPASDVLRAIAEEEPENVFVIAWPNDGKEPTFHSSTADLPVVMMRVQQFIHDIYAGKFR